MKNILSYRLFESHDFDTLANMGTLKKVIIHLVKIHEMKAYDGKTLISSNTDFSQKLSGLIQSSVDSFKAKKFIDVDQWINLVNDFENNLYKSTKLSDKYSESLSSSFDDLVMTFQNYLKGTYKTDEFQKECDHMLSQGSEIISDDSQHKEPSQDMKLVYKDEEGNILKDPSAGEIWDSPKAFFKECENHIGKPFKDFDYADKMKAYDWLENHKYLSDISKSEKDGLMKDWRETLGL